MGEKKGRVNSYHTGNFIFSTKLRDRVGNAVTFIGKAKCMLGAHTLLKFAQLARGTTWPLPAPPVICSNTLL